MKNVFFEGERAVRKPLCPSIPEGVQRLVGDRSVLSAPWATLLLIFKVRGQPRHLSTREQIRKLLPASQLPEE